MVVCVVKEIPNNKFQVEVLFCKVHCPYVLYYDMGVPSISKFQGSS